MTQYITAVVSRPFGRETFSTRHREDQSRHRVLNNELFLSWIRAFDFSKACPEKVKTIKQVLNPQNTQKRCKIFLTTTTALLFFT
jgi:hypothetical protein